MKHNIPSQNQNPTGASSPITGDLSQDEINFVPSPDEVSRRAYFSYVNQGSRSGHDVQHWLEAEKPLLEERARPRARSFHNKT